MRWLPYELVKLAESERLEKEALLEAIRVEIKRVEYSLFYREERILKTAVKGGTSLLAATLQGLRRHSEHQTDTTSQIIREYVEDPYIMRMAFELIPYLEDKYFFYSTSLQPIIAGIELYSDEVKDRIAGDDLHKKIMVLVEATTYAVIWRTEDHTYGHINNWGTENTILYYQLPEPIVMLLLDHYERHEEIGEHLIEREPDSLDALKEYLETPRALTDGFL